MRQLILLLPLKELWRHLHNVFLLLPDPELLYINYSQQFIRTRHQVKLFFLNQKISSLLQPA